VPAGAEYDSGSSSLLPPAVAGVVAGKNPQIQAADAPRGGLYLWILTSHTARSAGSRLPQQSSPFVLRYLRSFYEAAVRVKLDFFLPMRTCRSCHP